MFNLFKKKPKTNQSILSLPKTVEASVLYELLLNHRKGCTTHYLVSNFVAMNPQNCIMELRRKGLHIKCDMLEKVNRFDRKISYGIYYLIDFSDGIKMYNKINK
jgi:hypothetical protein